METNVVDTKGDIAEALPAPGGIGMAVAVDWGLTVQIALTAILPFVYSSSHSGMMNMPGAKLGMSNILLAIVALIAACLFALFGEMVRSGRNWARIVQIIFSSVLTLAGLFGLINLYHGVSMGNYWPVVTEIILVIISPLVVWRMTRPATVRWFKEVTPEQARERHGGRWVWFIILFSLIGGVLQTLAAMH